MVQSVWLKAKVRRIMRARIGLWGLALGLWAIAVPLPAVARDLTVGVEAIDYSPIYAWRDGQFVGATREILDAFAQANGHRLIFRPLPVKRLLAELIHGGIDLKFPDNPEWQLAVRQGAILAYSAPVFAYIDGTVVRSDRVGQGAGAVRTLGTVAGFTPFSWKSLVEGGSVELKENPGFEPLLRQVLAGRIDGAYVNVAVAHHMAASLPGGQGGLSYDPDLPHISDSYRLSSRVAPEIVAEFDAWLAAHQGVVAAIVARTGAEAGLKGAR